MDKNHKLTDIGDVKIHNNAIKSITALTISKIKGVVRIYKSPMRKMLDNLNLNKTNDMTDGIRVETVKSGTRICVDVITAYGMDISEIAGKVQDDVKQAVESMTGITLAEVDVNVVGVEQGG